MSLYYQNCRGLRTKTTNFFKSCLNSDFDVICVTESWLQPHIGSGELLPGGYDMFRKDRCETGSSRNDGGGVFIAVDQRLQAKLVPPWMNGTVVEDVWVRIPIAGGKFLFLGVCYFPPYCSSVDYSVYFDYVTSLMEEFVNDTFVLVGDFNLPDLVWSYNVKACCYCCDVNNKDLLVDFKNFTSYNSLFQFNGHCNKNGKILDLMLSDCPDVEVFPGSLPFVAEDPHHPSLEVLIRISPICSSVKRACSGYKFFKADYDLITSSLNSVDWKNFFDSSDVDECVGKFYTKINEIIEKYVPKRSLNCTKFPTWFSKNTISLIVEKKRYHRKFKRFKNGLYYEIFSNLRRQCKCSIIKDYSVYVDSVEGDIVANPRSFWSFVGNARRSGRIPSAMLVGDDVVVGDGAVSDGFSEYFASVFETSDKPVLISGGGVCTSSMFLKNIEHSDIVDKINKLDVNKGPGPDDIPPVFIKSCGSALGFPLQLIFNKSLENGVFPNKWKLAKVVPIFKSGKKNILNNYRPVSILSIFGKLFESIITDQIFSFAKQKISTNQHGFFRGRSTLSNLSVFSNYVCENVDNGFQVDAVYTDIAKAFDRVHHATLITLLSEFGLNYKMLRWIESYLTGRQQFVVVNGVNSGMKSVTSGVPQGSHLGPLLFLIYINDISLCFRSVQFALFADDLKVFMRVVDERDLWLFQDDLDRLTSFCSARYLTINIEKCKHITFTRNKDVLKLPFRLNDEIVETVHHIKDLGIIFDSKFSFSDHVDHIVTKSYKMLGFVLRVSKCFKNVNTLMILYFSLVRSVLEYNTPIWTPFYHKYIDRIEMVQRKFIKSMNYRYNPTLLSADYNVCLERYGIISLEKRRILFDQVFLHRTINNHFNYSLINYINFNVPSYRNRRFLLFAVPRARTSLYYNSLFPRVMRFYNWHLLYIDILAIGLCTFRRRVLGYLNTLL